MVDLKEAKVGDFYLLENGNEVSVRLINETQVVLEDEKGFYLNRTSDGTSCEGFKEFNVIQKKETRWWLEELPNTDIFNDEVKWIACDAREYGWCTYTKEPDLSTIHWSASFGGSRSLDNIKMPKLNGDEWKDSLISIEELRVFQNTRTYKNTKEKVLLTKGNLHLPEAGDKLIIERFSDFDGYEPEVLVEGVEYTITNVGRYSTDYFLEVNGCVPYLTQGNAKVWCIKQELK